MNLMDPRTDARTVSYEVKYLYNAASPMATSLIIRSLKDITNAKLRSQACETLICDCVSLYDRDTVSIGVSEVLQAMVATRRLSVVEAAFDMWQRLHERDRGTPDAETTAMLASAMTARNHTSAVAAAAVMFVIADSTHDRQVAARRLGAELKEFALPASDDLIYTADRYIRKDSDNKPRWINSEAVAADSSVWAYTFKGTARAANRNNKMFLIRAVQTVLESLSRYMTLERSRLLLCEFPPSWPLACLIQRIRSSRHWPCLNWPAIMGSEASLSALRAMCDLISAVCDSWLDPPLPWERYSSLENDLPLIVREASKSPEFEKDPAIEEGLKLFERFGISACYDEVLHGTPPSDSRTDKILRFREQLAGNPREPDPAVCWALIEDITCSSYSADTTALDSDKLALLEVFCSTLRSVDLSDSRVPVDSLCSAALSLTHGLGLTHEQTIRYLPVGCVDEAFEELESYSVIAPSARSAAALLRSVEEESKKRYPDMDPQAVMSLMRSASDVTISLREFFDSHTALFTR